MIMRTTDEPNWIETGDNGEGFHLEDVIETIESKYPSSRVLKINVNEETNKIDIKTLNEITGMVSRFSLVIKGIRKYDE